MKQQAIMLLTIVTMLTLTSCADASIGSSPETGERKSVSCEQQDHNGVTRCTRRFSGGGFTHYYMLTKNGKMYRFNRYPEFGDVPTTFRN